MREAGVKGGAGRGRERAEVPCANPAPTVSLALYPLTAVLLLSSMSWCSRSFRQ